MQRRTETSSSAGRLYGFVLSYLHLFGFMNEYFKKDLCYSGRNLSTGLNQVPLEHRRATTPTLTPRSLISLFRKARVLSLYNEFIIPAETVLRISDYIYSTRLPAATSVLSLQHDFSESIPSETFSWCPFTLPLLSHTGLSLKGWMRFLAATLQNFPID
jgi:hypothetical protein